MFVCGGRQIGQGDAVRMVSSHLTPRPRAVAVTMSSESGERGFEPTRLREKRESAVCPSIPYPKRQRSNAEPSRRERAAQHASKPSESGAHGALE